MSKTKRLSKEEVLFIFQEEHRLCSKFDCEADESIKLTFNSSIDDWRDSLDLLPWKPLSRHLNRAFKIDIDTKTWKSVLVGDKKLLDVCELISSKAEINIIKPQKIFGTSCLSYSVFQYIKLEFEERGIDTKNLRPSSLVSPYLNNHFEHFIEFFNINFTGTIPEIVIKSSNHKFSSNKWKTLSKIFWSLIFIMIAMGLNNPLWLVICFSSIALYLFVSFKFLMDNNRYSLGPDLYIPEVITFKGLINRIIKEKKLHSIN
ncbi:hypothetical protein [Flammeovirga sp. SJP92]|uniref:hypothetical protein n=1 Tax=Flammeovirga sp. SJP92 TaxID=1775430 RepID=UPI0007889DDE|nr:hypothetical protein [Flammeovirga sp. SJP92]KXX69120.1 hypothetical protein AVL50_16920 [Flammeovirga sp. SJP92]